MKELDNYELRINNIIDNYAYMFLQNPNIIAVGNGNKEINGTITHEPSLMFFVKKKVDFKLLNPSMVIPKKFNGVSTDVIESGQSKFDIPYYRSKSSLRSPYKSTPALGGGCLKVDFSEDKIYVGTLGYAVTEKVTRKSIYFLTSAHFLNIKGSFKLGKKVYYSSSVENPNEEDWLLGLMQKIVPIKYEAKFLPITYNLCDAGIGYAGVNDSKTREFLSLKLTNGKVVKGIEKVKKGDIVYKVGIITGYTEGVVTSVNVIGKFTDRDEKTFYLKDQIIAEMKGEEGDSGALGVIKNTDKAFGMLNGGVTLEGGRNLIYFSDIENVFKELDVELLI